MDEVTGRGSGVAAVRPLRRGGPCNGILNVHKDGGTRCDDLLAYLQELSGDTPVRCCLPLATSVSGVVPVAIGLATRVARCVLSATRSYLVDAVLSCPAGEGSDPRRSAGPPSPGRLTSALQSMSLNNRTVIRHAHHPDASSNGITLQFAVEPCRGGSTRLVELRVERYSWPDLRLMLTSVGDTDIHTIIEDIWSKTGLSGSIGRIVRTSVGAMSRDRSWRPVDIAGAWMRGRLDDFLVPWRRVLPHLPHVTVHDPEIRSLVMAGASFPLEKVAPRGWNWSGELLLVTDKRNALAICDVAQSVVTPRDLLCALDPPHEQGGRRDRGPSDRPAAAPGVKLLLLPDCDRLA